MKLSSMGWCDVSAGLVELIWLEASLMLPVACANWVNCPKRCNREELEKSTLLGDLFQGDNIATRVRECGKKLTYRTGCLRRRLKSADLSC